MPQTRESPPAGGLSRSGEAWSKRRRPQPNLFNVQQMTSRARGRRRFQYKFKREGSFLPLSHPLSDNFYVNGAPQSYRPARSLRETQVRHPMREFKSKIAWSRRASSQVPNHKRRGRLRRLSKPRGRSEV